MLSVADNQTIGLTTDDGSTVLCMKCAAREIADAHRIASYMQNREGVACYSRYQADSEAHEAGYHCDGDCGGTHQWRDGQEWCPHSAQIQCDECATILSCLAGAQEETPTNRRRVDDVLRHIATGRLYKVDDVGADGSVLMRCVYNPAGAGPYPPTRWLTADDVADTNRWEFDRNDAPASNLEQPS